MKECCRRYDSNGNVAISRIWKGEAKLIDLTSAFKQIQLALSESNFFLTVEEVPLEDCNGRFLAQDVWADRDQPPFDRVAMDGIAISRNCLTQKRFIIQDIQKAGTAPLELQSLENCIEVMTGSVLPIGCDLVVPYEMLEISAGIASIKNSVLLTPRLNVHLKGQDFKASDQLISRDRKINARHISVMASVGLETVKVYRFPSISLLSTGDELVKVQDVPEAHQIRQSNLHAMAAEFQSNFFANIDKMHLLDCETEIEKALSKKLETCSIICLTGGVSAGKFDFVPKILEKLGVKKIFHKVAQRPGKPLWFGRGLKGQIVIGFPGNPVSCLVLLRRYLIEAFRLRFHMSGAMAKLSNDFSFMKPMTLLLPVRIDICEGELWAHPMSGNGSGDYFSLTDTQGFLELSPRTETFKKGELFPLYLWGAE